MMEMNLPRLRSDNLPSYFHFAIGCKEIRSWCLKASLPIVTSGMHHLHSCKCSHGNEDHTPLRDLRSSTSLSFCCSCLQWLFRYHIVQLHVMRHDQHHNHRRDFFVAPCYKH